MKNVIKKEKPRRLHIMFLDNIYYKGKQKLGISTSLLVCGLNLFL